MSRFRSTLPPCVIPCGYCRKLRYRSRREAKRALRHFHPGSVGNQMHAYRSICGGGGWHLGHRDPVQFAPERGKQQAA